MVTVELGGYRARQVLARCGPVTVYLADHEGREVALWVAEGSGLGLNRESFLHHVGALRRLPPHLPIGRTLDGGATPSLFWVVTEHHRGVTWAALFRGEKASPGPLTMAELALEVAPPLEEAARSGLVHGGLGPAAVVMTPEDRLVVVNFGLAALFRCPIALEERYRAPEHVRPEMALDARTDVYGMGMILYQLLAVRPPYQDHAPGSLGRCVLSEPLDMTGVGIPPALQEIIHRATAKDPTERYPSVAALREALLDACTELALTTLGHVGVLPSSGIRHHTAEPAEPSMRSGEIPATERTPPCCEAGPVPLKGARRRAFRSGRVIPRRAPRDGIPRIVWAAIGLGLMGIGAVLPGAAPPPAVRVAAPLLLPLLAPESPMEPTPEAPPTPTPPSSAGAGPPTAEPPPRRSPTSVPSAEPAPPAVENPPSETHQPRKAKRFPWENPDPCAISWYLCSLSPGRKNYRTD
jgi:serine/threonine-protein kinase